MALKGCVTTLLTHVMALVAMTSTTSPMLGQTPVEMGVDAGLTLGGNGTDIDIVTVAIPVTSFRVGLHPATHWSLETAVGLTTISANSTDVTALSMSLVGLYHFGADPTRTRFHLLAGIPFQYAHLGSQSTSDSEAEFGVTGGAGLTVPVIPQLAVRLQARYQAMFNTRTELSVLVGLSFFTH